MTMNLINTSDFHDYVRLETRRQFFARGMSAVGAAALATLGGNAAEKGSKTGFAAALPETHFPAKAKNVIYLHMVGPRCGNTTTRTCPIRSATASALPP
jgi:hypothetical protein